MPVAHQDLPPPESYGEATNPAPGWRNDLETRISYGPVPSRRLGMSIGINNIPPKHCTCSCGYCQVGRTTAMSIEPCRFFGPEAILADVSQRVSEVRAMGGVIDHLTFVADGEPTLDIDLGLEIEALRALGIPVAVITNGTLLWRDDVREALERADWVSVKIDAVDDSLWRRVNRSHPGLNLKTILGGIGRFAGGCSGTIATETMLIGSVNDSEEAVTETAECIAGIAPDTAYIGTPHRPPVERRFRVPSPASLKRASRIFSERIGRVELLGQEADSFVSTENARSDILSISSVHPMEADAIKRLLADAGAGWEVLEDLLSSGELTKTRYRGRVFYARRSRGRRQPDAEGRVGI